MMASTPFNPERFRTFFAQLPTGVTVIVGRGSSGPVGLIVGTFSSVSLDPPLVSFMVRTESRSFEAVRGAGRFTANVLASDQGQLSKTLAGWSPDKFRDVTFEERNDDVLAIPGALAWAECIIDHQVDAGDHTIVLATPQEMTVVRPSARPLVFAQSGYHRTLRVEDARAPGWI